VLLMRVLVVEDDPGLAAVLARGLVESGFAVDATGQGADAIWLATENEYDVIVLDLGLPDIDGMTVLSRLRSAGRWAPILVLTARDGLAARVSGLDGGADDYLLKPFAFPELLARMRALARRGRRERPCILSVGDLTLDPATRDVRRDGREIALTATEFALLECLMRSPGQVLSRTQIIDRVWDMTFDRDSNVVDVYVGYLRNKVDRPFGRQTIRTVRGAGYRLESADAAV
jgi:two-component system OmpR family response regulator